MRIGYLMQADSVDMSEVSGPQVHVQSVVRGLERRGHKVRLLSIQQGQIQWCDDLLCWHAARFGFSRSLLFRAVESVLRGLQSRLRLPFFRFFDSLRFADACTLALADADVLYERYGLMNYGGLLAARRLGVPLVLEVNGDMVDEYGQKGIHLSRLQWVFIHVISRLMFASASHIVSVGEKLTEKLVSRWHARPDKISLIVNGTDYDLFAAPRDADAVRTRFGLRAMPTVVYVGGFFQWHGLDMLLQAVHDLQAHGVDAQLVLIGDGPERERMGGRAAALGLGERVVFTGLITQAAVADILAVADIAAAPYQNWTETTGMKIFDYMASGKAIVATSFDGQHTLLEHLRSGFLIQPGSQRQLTDAIETLLRGDDLRAQLGRNAQAKILHNFTWDHTAAKIEAVCNGAIGLRRAPGAEPAQPAGERS
ncbi:MAG: glycosyltransferase family 4 protein [Chloroflexi bacterium]|nr:glycosyltransferase family 4 protein [Chloroflexota bacterium]